MLPMIGSTVLIRGDHPWIGSNGVVIAHQNVGIVSKQRMARVRLQRDDAMDGHECYANENHVAVTALPARATDEPGEGKHGH